MTRHQDSRVIFVVALLIAIFLTLAPLPLLLEPLRPYWVALVLIYWTMEVPSQAKLGNAFLIGLLLDMLTGSLLGLHALSLVIMVYLVLRFRARMRFFPPWQQALSVFALLVNDRIILLWINALLGGPMPTWHYWLGPVAGMAVWPWIFLLLDYARFSRRHAKRR